MKQKRKESTKGKSRWNLHIYLTFHWEYNIQPLWKAELLNLIPHWVSVVTQKLYGSMNNGSLQEWKDKL